MGCFGFLRRNKKKKEKKRQKAISARAEETKSPVKRTSGGVAFDVVIDPRPPTPFRGLTPRPGRKQLSMDEKRQAFELTLIRREVKLGEKTTFARLDASRRAEVLQKKATGALDALFEVDEAGDVTPREEGQGVPSSSA